MLHNLKKKLAKAYTIISTTIVVFVLFVLQFVVIHGNLYFWKSNTFWMDLVVMVAILLIANEIYWKNGSSRGELNDKYINSAVEYSVRVSRLKNACLTEDFYNYIDEKNLEIFTSARNDYLEKHGISVKEYMGAPNLEPHANASKSRLEALERKLPNGSTTRYYSDKQIEVIMNATQGNFDYEVLSGTEILSGIKVNNKKYATSYNSSENKWAFAKKNLGIAILISFMGALIGADLAEHGWTLSALFIFFYRLLMLAWRAIVSDEAGYADIVDTKRGVNVNRSNLLTMYATARGYNELFADINTEISKVKKDYLQAEGETSGNN